MFFGQTGSYLIPTVAFLVLAGLLLGFFKWYRRELKLRQRIRERLAYIEKGEYSMFLPMEGHSLEVQVARTVNHLSDRIQEQTEKLANERRKTEYILDNMDSGLILVDRQMRVRQCNSSIYKYLSSSEDLVGAYLPDLVDDPHLIKAVQKALEKEIASVFDLDFTERSGAIVSARVNTAVGVWGGEENSVSVVIILTNVTQTRQMEQLRSEFVANVSHELKTPITSILGFGELLQAGMVQDEAARQEYLGRMVQEARRMSYLIDDILRLSSLEGKQAEEIYEQVDLAGLCTDIFQSMTPLLNQRKITYTIQGNVAYLAYPDDMRQLLKNLIENAVKYNREEGHIAVQLTSDGLKCIIGVADSGIGIPMEHQARIFERFYRVDKGRSKREGGTGLGLSIVKHIAAKYGGKITLSSKVDQGTSIRVALPIQPKLG